MLCIQDDVDAPPEEESPLEEQEVDLAELKDEDESGESALAQAFRSLQSRDVPDSHHSSAASGSWRGPSQGQSDPMWMPPQVSMNCPPCLPCIHQPEI